MQTEPSEAAIIAVLPNVRSWDQCFAAEHFNQRSPLGRVESDLSPTSAIDEFNTSCHVLPFSCKHLPSGGRGPSLGLQTEEYKSFWRHGEGRSSITNEASLWGTDAFLVSHSFISFPFSTFVVRASETTTGKRRTKGSCRRKKTSQRLQTHSAFTSLCWPWKCQEP